MSFLSHLLFKGANCLQVFFYMTFKLGDCTFVDKHTVEVTAKDGSKTQFMGDKIMIATGGRPHFPEGEGVEEHCISSDGFFEMEELPKVAVVVGAGYIAVETKYVTRDMLDAGKRRTATKQTISFVCAKC
eukprot:scaffold88057_cov68-Cyclotella_meneghiniana.AAC.3